MLGFAAETCLLSEMIDLSTEVLPGYAEYVEDYVFVSAFVVCLSKWVVCQVEVIVELYPYVVKGCEKMPYGTQLQLVRLVGCEGGGGPCFALLCVGTDRCFGSCC